MRISPWNCGFVQMPMLRAACALNIPSNWDGVVYVHSHSCSSFCQLSVNFFNVFSLLKTRFLLLQFQWFSGYSNGPPPWTVILQVISEEKTSVAMSWALFKDALWYTYTLDIILYINIYHQYTIYHIIVYYGVVYHITAAIVVNWCYVTSILVILKHV